MRYGRLSGWIALGTLAVAPAIAEGVQSPVYSTSEQVAGHSYGYWNMQWARYEWEPGRKESPLVAGGCKAKTVGNVIFLPGLGKDGQVTCKVPTGKSIFLPTASELYTHTSKKDAPASKIVRLVTESYPKGVKVLTVSLDGKPINARAYASVTKLFQLKPRPGSIIGATGSFAAAQGGYNLLLRPLDAGKHTIKTHVKIVQGGKLLFESRVTFKLDIG